MTTVLRQRFPMLRSREEVTGEIFSREDLRSRYVGWTKVQQEAFLDFCTGVRGLKPLYDQFFKEVFNPEIKPERLEEILSLLLKRQVKILQVLPHDSKRMAAETSLLILDIVIQLEDKSICNVEIQRIGYAFPGQRCACYSADLLLRQYKRIKKEKGREFSYRDIQKVYTIVFFEKSTGEFHRFPEDHIHYMKQQSDTGIKIDLLQEYVFIALDIFRAKLHNNGIETANRLEAWLTFLCEDDPEWVLKLTEVYPEFEMLYGEVYQMCRNTECIMENFSEELAELDKNTVQYMIDELQDMVDAKVKELAEKEEMLSQKVQELQEKELLIAQLKKKLDDSKKDNGL